MDANSDHVKFFHFVVNNGHATAAYRLDDNVKSNVRTVRCAFSFCSPRDQFVKSLGRTRANGRLKSQQARQTTFHIPENKSFYQTLTSVLLEEAGKLAKEMKLSWYDESKIKRPNSDYSD